MVLNWDQTTIKYIPLSEWTMAQKESKKVEVLGIDGKCQITAMFAAPLSGNFLPIQLIYEGKTSRCNPAVDFPEGYHWCNEQAMISYIKSAIVPYRAEEKTVGFGC